MMLESCRVAIANIEQGRVEALSVILVLSEVLHTVKELVYVDIVVWIMKRHVRILGGVHYGIVKNEAEHNHVAEEECG